jgi:RNA recognition motif-containing protein
VEDLESLPGNRALATDTEAVKQGSTTLVKKSDEIMCGAHAFQLHDAINSSNSNQSSEALPREPAECVELADSRTTVMLRSFPNNYNSAMLLELIDSKGFKGWYDFVYLPIDFMTGSNLGYGFLNFTSHENAVKFIESFDGFSEWTVPSKKCCTVVWSDPHQGSEAYVERYRNSPVMHRSVPIQYKPALFKDGERIPFPPPTKNVRAPRLRFFTNSW